MQSFRMPLIRHLKESFGAIYTQDEASAQRRQLGMIIGEACTDHYQHMSCR
jgi:hypothetical protein